MYGTSPVAAMQAVYGPPCRASLSAQRAGVRLAPTPLDDPARWAARRAGHKGGFGPAWTQREMDGCRSYSATAAQDQQAF